MVIRELLTRFGFQVDTARLEQFESTIAELKGQLATLQERLGIVDATAKTTGEAMAGAFAGVPEGVDVAARSVSTLGEHLAQLRAQAIETGTALKQALGIHGTGGAAAEEGAIAGGSSGHGGGFGHIGGLVAGYFGIEAGMGLVEDFSKFQQNMQKAGANMLASKAEIEKMNKAAIGMAVGLNQTPEELSEALKEIGLQGFQGDAAGAMKVLPVAAMFSKAVMATPTQSAELIASTTRNFYGKDFSQAGRVGDVLSRVHEIGGLQAQDMIDSLKYVAPTAHAFKQSFESIATDLATLGQSGIKGSQTGTALNNILLSMTGKKLTNRTIGMIFPGRHIAKGEVTTVWKELGIKTEDAHQNLLPMSEVFDQLRAKTAHMGTGEQGRIFKAIFGQAGVTSAMVINASKSFAENQKSIEGSAGNLKRVYGIQTKTGIKAAWDLLRAAVESLASKIFEKTMPAVEMLVRALANGIPIVTAVAAWLYKTKIVLAAIGFVGATMALDALVVAVNTKMIPALIRMAIAAWGSVKAFFGYIGSMIRATIAAGGFVIANAAAIGTVALLAAGLVLMWAAFNSGNPVVMKINKAIADATHGFWGLGQLIAKSPILSKLFGITSSGNQWKHGAPNSPENIAWLKSHHLGATIPLAPRVAGRTGAHHHTTVGAPQVTIHVASGDPHAIGHAAANGVSTGMRHALALAASQVPRHR